MRAFHVVSVALGSLFTFLGVVKSFGGAVHPEMYNEILGKTSTRHLPALIQLNLPVVSAAIASVRPEVGCPHCLFFSAFLFLCLCFFAAGKSCSSGVVMLFEQLDNLFD